jgi:phosphoribosylformylglycinamidine (FGAM) synthase-like enzyme
MAIAAGCGARLAVEGSRPTAALFGERAGRVIVACGPAAADPLRAALAEAGVPGRRVGVAGGDRLEISAAPQKVTVAIDDLKEAWRRPF